MFSFTVHNLQNKLKRAIIYNDNIKAWDIMRQLRQMNVNTSVKYIK